MGRIIIPEELIKSYEQRLIDREEIAKKIGIDYNTISQIFYRRHIKLWDGYKARREQNENLIELYRNKKATRIELAREFNIKLNKISSLLRSHDIKIWDRIRGKRDKRREKTGKYFNLKDYKNHYFYNYNK